MARVFLFFIPFLLALSTNAQSADAFPGAVGLGKATTGGRNGAIVKVTNLNDSGAGSLRACLEDDANDGARFCLVLVDGDIYLDSEIVIGDSNVTLAGQTAPGQGIQLRNGDNERNGIYINASNVIIRHIRVNLGPNLWDPYETTDAECTGAGTPESCCTGSGTGTCDDKNYPNPGVSDFCLHNATEPWTGAFDDCCTTVPNAFQIAGMTNSVDGVVLDHVSVHWLADQLIASNQDSMRVTISNSIFSEGLNRSSHCAGLHSKGPNMRGCGWTHWGNYIASSDIRNPNTTCGKDGDGVFGTHPNGVGSPSGITYFVNNVVFGNQTGYDDIYTGRGESWHNIVGNVFRRGSDTRLNNNMPHAIDAHEYPGAVKRDYSAAVTASGTSDPIHLCLEDNLVIGLAGSTGASDGSHVDSQYAGLRGDGDANFCTGAGTPYACCTAAGDGKTCGDDTHLVESTDCVNSPVTEATTYDGTPACPGGYTCYDWQIQGTPIASSQVVASVKANAGAFFWDRDDNDQRVLDYYDDGEDGGSIIDHPFDEDMVANQNCTASNTPWPCCTGLDTGDCGSTGWPTLDTGTAPTDTDGDGIPDSVESACGWSTTVANAWDDHDSDGYGNIEEYVNYLAQDQSTVCSGYPTTMKDYLPLRRI